MPTQLRIGLLGPLAVGESPHAVAGLPSPTQRRLLSILALEAGHLVSAERLCTILECTQGSLRTSISRLRARIGAEHLHTAPPGYVLAATTDLEDLESLVAEASTAPSPGAAIGILDRALALWRGAALGEFRDESWAIHAVARAEELHAAAIEMRAEALVAEGRLDQAIAALTPEETRAVMACRRTLLALAGENRTATLPPRRIALIDQH